MSSPEFGTAPRRVKPGVWVTRSGRNLTRAGAHYWEGMLQRGATDGFGHFVRTATPTQTKRYAVASPASPVAPVTPFGTGRIYLPKPNELKSDYYNRMRSYAKLQGDAQGGPDLQTSAFSIPRLGQVLTGGARIAEGIPVGLGKAAAGSGMDIYDTARGRPTLKRTWKGWVEEPAKGFAETAQHPMRDPLATATSLAMVLAGAKGIKARVAGAKAAIAEGDYARAALPLTTGLVRGVKGYIKKPAPSEVAKIQVPTNDGSFIEIPVRTSLSPLAADITHRNVRGVNKALAAPEEAFSLRILNPNKRVGSAWRHQEEILGRTKTAAPAALEKFGSTRRADKVRRGKGRGKELSVGGQKAGHVFSSGIPIEQHILGYQKELERNKANLADMERQGAPPEQIQAITENIGHNQRQLDELAAAKPLIDAADQNVMTATNLSRKLAMEREKLIGVSERDRNIRLGKKATEIQQMAKGERSLAMEHSDLVSRLKTLSPEGVDYTFMEKRIVDLEQKFLEEGTKAYENGAFYVHATEYTPPGSIKATPGRSIGRFGKGPPRERLSEMDKLYTGWLDRVGKGRSDFTGQVADSYRAALKLDAQQRGYAFLSRIGKKTLAEAGDGAIPFRATKEIPQWLRDLKGRADQGVLSKEDIANSPNLESALHDYYTNVDGLPPEDIVFVPKDTYDQMYPEPIKPNVVDKLNAGFRAGMLYATPKYIINLPQQLGTALIQQGVVRLKRNLKTLSTLNEEDRQMLYAAGQGGSRFRAMEQDVGLKGSFSKLQDVADSAGEHWSRITDRTLRASAIVDELDRLGYNTTERIHRVLTDPSLKDDLFQGISRGDQASVSFADMSQLERKTAKRALLFYPWLRGSAVWSIRFPLEHPYQAAYYAQIGKTGADYAEKQWGGPIPSYLHGRLRLAGNWVVNPSMLSNFSTIPEIIRDPQGPSPQVFWSMLNAAYTNKDISTGRRPQGPMANLFKGRLGAVLEEAAGTFGPYSVAKRAVKSGGITLGGPWAALSQFLLGSASGGPVDIQKAHNIGERERRIGEGLQGRIAEDLQKQKDKIEATPLSREVKDKLGEVANMRSVLSASYQAIEKTTQPGPERESAKLDALLGVLGPDHPATKSISAYLLLHPKAKGAIARRVRRTIEKRLLLSATFALINKEKK